jgi:uncharacterized protein YjbJ (UPF0337 family)
MNQSERKLSNTKDKVVGEIKEAAGKATGNEQLELKGKIQSSKADLKMKVEDVRDEVASAINLAIDKKGNK